MQTNGDNKLHEIIYEYYYLDYGLLKLEKDGNRTFCWGEWQDKSFGNYPTFCDIPLEKIDEYLSNAKN